MYNILEILQYTNPIELKKFYKELKKFSYYNSFYRVQTKLTEFGLISIEKIDNKQYIKLTEKGVRFYQKLYEIYKLITEKEE